jgi:hypothetical protein
MREVTGTSVAPYVGAILGISGGVFPVVAFSVADVVAVAIAAAAAAFSVADSVALVPK